MSSNNQNEKHPMDITYMGAHYKLCPVEIRELWTGAFDSPEGRKHLAETAQECFQMKESNLVPLFTCNRFDLCIQGTPSDDELMRFFNEITAKAMTLSKRTLSKESKLTLGSLALLKKAIRIRKGKLAAEQLFSVACSLDSLVLGEPHILGQIKEQYAIAKDLKLCGTSLSPFFNRCFSVAKKVRTETDLGRSAVSIGHAAVLLVTRVFENLSNHTALVIGAGEMGRLAAQHLMSRQIGSLTIANRSKENALKLQSELENTAGNTISITDLEDRLTEFDIVIVATSSRDYLIEGAHLSHINKVRKGRPMVMVDISVPRNVNPQCADVSDCLFLFDVDDLDKVMDENREARKESADAALVIIKKDLENFEALQQQKTDLLPVGQFHQLVLQTVMQELAKESAQNLSTERAAIISAAVAKRLVSSPAKLAKNGNRFDEASAGEALNALFSLETQPEKKNN